ncbi:Serine/threonine-protein kinase StkP [Rosistilla ulvae]|uniref:Serine/threonine-protein kinase StkP n=1 Tax=Rosistilla ulvae TaxID=1930277 RepID=A0A517LYZ8_9BACT|nr:Hsp70 family protein [Rosistilla ulvae]QDS87854.1 Serine/threonine-protein kinase StkP [Rosistilla ulvae]
MSEKPKSRPKSDVTQDLDAASAHDPHESDFSVAEDNQELPLPIDIGDYTLTRLIGSGGMGRVYHAMHRPMQRTVALKTLPPSRMQNQKAVERFYTEVRAAARLMHPNIVTAFDAGHKGDQHYLAMEYVEGATLTQIVRESGPLELSLAVDLIRQAATGLQHAHRAGIVHRDVKPSNLMLTPDEVVKVLDLGLATIGSETGTHGRRGRLVGTIEYMAPEQIEDASNPDRRNDIYSLGATFFFLLTGRTLYQGGILEQARAHRDEPLPDLFALRPDVDVRLDQVLRRMLAKRLDGRYSSLAEVLEDLDEWSAGATLSDWTDTGARLTLPSEQLTDGVEPTTAVGRSSVLGLDVGMFYVAAAMAEAGQPIRMGNAGSNQQPLLQSAVATTREEQTIFGGDAIQLRTKTPHRLAHCVQLYLGTTKLDRHIGDRQCPPEVAIGMIMRHAARNAWQLKGRPAVVAVTVPACYDQARRRSTMQAAQVAGFDSIRLIDRPLAAAQSQLIEEHAALPPPKPSEVCYWLVASVTGLAMEISVVRHVGGRLQLLSSVGDWNLGLLTWQQRVVDLAATDCLRRLRLDPRKELKDAVSLQLACEKALRQLSIKPQADLDFRLQGRAATVTLKRATFGAACSDLLVHLNGMIGQALHDSGIDPTQLSNCLTVGMLTRMPQITEVLHGRIGSQVPIIAVDRPALAAGAASAVMGELPGQTHVFPAPHSCCSHDLGLLIRDGKRMRPRTVPVLTRSTKLPARKTRRLLQPQPGQRPALTLIESAGWQGDAWRSLGNFHLPEHSSETPLEAVLEVDANGLLKVGVHDPNTGHVQRVPPLPQPMIDEADLPTWRAWVDKTMR